MIGKRLVKSDKILDFGSRLEKRREDDATHLVTGKTRRLHGNVDRSHNMSVSRTHRYGNRAQTELQFLVDDGLTCPPDLSDAGRQRLPVRNGLGRVGADRRLAEKTGEFGVIQL